MSVNILSLQGMSTDKVINNQGSIGVVYQHEKLQQDVRTLLLTQKNSLIGNPNYGSNLYTYIFDEGNSADITLLKAEISEILTNNYNFINKVDTKTKIENNTLTIKISYTTTTDNLSSTLEYTFPLDENNQVSYT